MEADVALHAHASEAWVKSADPRTDKLKYGVYSNRRREREREGGGGIRPGRKSSSSRIQQMKASRSYDNEIEASVKRDTAELSLRGGDHNTPTHSTTTPYSYSSTSSSPHRRSRDDSTLEYEYYDIREKSPRSPPCLPTRIPNSSKLGLRPPGSGVHSQSPSRIKQSPDLRVHHRDNYRDQQVIAEGGGEGRWIPKPRKHGKGGKKPPNSSTSSSPSSGGGEMRNRHEHRRTLEKQCSLPEASIAAMMSVSPTMQPPPTNQQMLRTAMSVDEQLETAGEGLCPTHEDQRQMMTRPNIPTLDLRPGLPPSSSSASSPSTSAYRGPSPGIVLETKGGQALHYKPSGTMLSDSSSMESWGTTAAANSRKVYDPDERPLPALKNRSRHHPQTTTDLEGVEVELVPLIDDELFPVKTTAGSDASVSKTEDRPLPALQNRARLPTSVDDRMELVPLVDDSFSPATSKARTDLVASIQDPATAAPLPTAKTTASESAARINANDSSKMSHDDLVVGPSSHSASHFDTMSSQGYHSATSTFSSFNALHDMTEETAFCSPSILFQQKAGIRHDDMVVGPVSKKLPPLDPYGPSPYSNDNAPSPYPTDENGSYANAKSMSSEIPGNSCHGIGLEASPLSSHVQPVTFPINTGTGSKLRSDGSNFPVSDFEKDYYKNATAETLIESRKLETTKDGSCRIGEEFNVCDSPPSSRSLSKVKGGEKKPRRASPGSGIPVRQGMGDRSRGTSPIASAVSPATPTETVATVPPIATISSPTIADDSKYGSSQSLPGSSAEPVRWRPKEKKSAGVGRMRREGKKKEKNVSVESGYLTDHALYSDMTSDASVGGGFSPVHQHAKDLSSPYLGEQNAFHSLAGAPGSLDRKSKPLTHPATRIPASPSSSRSKSANTTPVKKSGKTLSSIPIPVAICHDERVRKQPPPQPKPQSPLDLDPPSVSQPQSPTRHLADSPVTASHDGWNFGPNKSFDSNSVSQSQGSVHSIPSIPSFPVTPDEVIEDRSGNRKIPSAKAGKHRAPTTTTGASSSLPSPSLATASSTSSLPATAISLLAAPNAPSSVIDNVSTSSSAATATPKVRLHRSAEHLVAGTNKLTVYRGPDEGEQPDDSASDISVATACSMPAKTGAGSSSCSRPPVENEFKRLDYDKARTKALSHDIILDSSLSSSSGRSASGKTRVPIKAKGRCVSLLRKEKERSTAIVRRGSDRAVPVDRNDPSAVGLMAATSLKELCQSVASLLNIDNEKAAEMLSTSLSTRQDLVEGLDADAILDYLTHHGVLDPHVLDDLQGHGQGQAQGQRWGEVSSAVVQRNSVILRQVEEHGDTAVALFINALRQSGQLHLASSLDTETRIRLPASGCNSYFGKSRHKGEISIRLEVDALKILAPRDPTERNVNLSLLSSSPAGNEGPTVVTDDEDDQVKPRSCWCFCISRNKRKERPRSSSKKDRRRNGSSSKRNKGGHQWSEEGGGGDYDEDGRLVGSDPTAVDSSLNTAAINERLHPDPRLMDRGHHPNATPHRTKSMDRGNNSSRFTNEGTNGSSNAASSSLPLSSTPPSSRHAKPTKSGPDQKKANTKKTKHKSSGKPDVPPDAHPTATLDSDLQSVPEVAVCSPTRGAARSSARKGKSGPSKAVPKDLKLRPQQASAGGHKDNSSDGIIMEYDAQLELVKLRAGHDELASPTRQAGPVGILVEQWRSSGKYFQAKAEMLCQAIVSDFVTDIVKYFEQDRGTLVLDVISEGTAVVVFNICMTKAQVKRLQEEQDNGRLLDKMQELFTSKVDVAKFDIRGVRYRMALDENELNCVLSELS